MVFYPHILIKLNCCDVVEKGRVWRLSTNIYESIKFRARILDSEFAINWNRIRKEVVMEWSRGSHLLTKNNNYFQASHVHFSVFVLWFGLGGLCISIGFQWDWALLHFHLIFPFAGGIAFQAVMPFQVLFSTKVNVNNHERPWETCWIDSTQGLKQVNSLFLR